MKKLSIILLLALFLGLNSYASTSGSDSSYEPSSSSQTTRKSSKKSSKSSKRSGQKGYSIQGNRIVTRDKWVVVDFYTDWCKYCPPYSEIFERVGRRFGGRAIFIRINAEEKRGIANYYNINSYPRTIILSPNDGGIRGEIKGLVDENTLYNSLSRYF